jgi:hypothetical protein
LARVKADENKSLISVDLHSSAAEVYFFTASAAWVSETQPLSTRKP